MRVGAPVPSRGRPERKGAAVLLGVHCVVLVTGEENHDMAQACSLLLEIDEDVTGLGNLTGLPQPVCVPVPIICSIVLTAQLAYSRHL